MEFYGYAAAQLSDAGLLRLREVSFFGEPAKLRQISEFLAKCADMLEAGTFAHSHRHIDEEFREWNRENVAADVIVCDPDWTADNVPRVM